ncbi:polysaccharide biosynthesis/export family protein, partial [Vibrio parahaemolyticus VP2007-007]
ATQILYQTGVAINALK